jgi:uncharacterized protein (TIGR02391 family)
MRIKDAIKELWKQNYFKKYRVTNEIAKEALDKFGATCSNTSAVLNDCKNFLRKDRKGWIQLESYDIIKRKKTEEIDLFKLLKIHPEIERVSKKLFLNGHYPQSIFEAFKKVNNLVKNRSQRTDLDGKNLMLTVFSVNNPILKFNNLVSTSDKDEQEGFMHLFAGAILGIRNPKGHDDIVQKDMVRTLEYLIFASLLCKRLEETKKV